MERWKNPLIIGESKGLRFLGETTSVTGGGSANRGEMLREMYKCAGLIPGLTQPAQRHKEADLLSHSSK